MQMAIAAAEPKKGRKHDQVLDGARTVFLRDGFEGASVDDIAREAGVSKATLYSYFPDKRLMFLAVARAECQRQADEAVMLIDFSASPRKVLTAAGERIVEFLLSEFSQRMFRICVAEADRFPELGRAFYESGPALVRDRVSDYLAKAVARGDLRIDDLKLAADQFHELCKADLFSRLIFGVASGATAAEVRRIVDGAVDTFLARYGA